MTSEELRRHGAASGHCDIELYFVLVGRVGRLTVWPCVMQAPSGWEIAFGPGTHGQCAAYLEEHAHDAPKLVGHHH